MKKKGLRYVLIALAIAIGLIWLNSTPKESYNGTPRQYKEITSSGVLRAVTEYNAVSYHVDQDTTLSGFDYEILREFAQSKNLKLQVVPEMNFSERLTRFSLRIRCCTPSRYWCSAKRLTIPTARS